MAKTLNPDARAAVQAAQKGNCRDALKYLYDAAPHMQTSDCGSERATSAAADYKHANIIVAGLCTVNRSKSSRKTEGFDGARRRRRRRR